MLKKKSGDVKGKIIDEIIREKKPQSILELGTYCGYSACRMASLMPEEGVLVTIDPFPQLAARRLVRQCGLREKVFFLNGPASKLIPSLKGMTL